MGSNTEKPAPNCWVASAMTSATVVPATSIEPVPAASRTWANKRSVAMVRRLVVWRYLQAVTSFLIVRHGQSVWNAAGRWQGQADPPLTELGQHQARMAAPNLPDFDVLVASTLQRANQTAQAIAEVRDVADVHLDARFMERDAGAFSGLTRVDIEREFPGYLGSGRWPDGWEDDGAVLTRVRAGLAHLADLHGDSTVVIISHGGIIYSIEGQFDIPHEGVSNLGGRWVHRASDGALTLGDRVHLLDLESETIPDQI